MSQSKNKLREIMDAHTDYIALEKWYSEFQSKVKESIDLYHETGHFSGLVVVSSSPDLVLSYAGRKLRFEFFVRPKNSGPSEGLITAYCHWGDSENGVEVGQCAYDPQGNITQAPEEMLFLSPGASSPLKNMNYRERAFNFVLHALHKGCCSAGYPGPSDWA